MIEVLKQPQYAPVRPEEQVVHVYVATGGHLDEYPAEDAKRFCVEFVAYLQSRGGDVLTSIRETGKLSDEDTDGLDEAIENFKDTFRSSAPEPGSEVAIGETTPPDEPKNDVGWDRMSSVDEDDADGGPASEAGASAPS